jgi:hypothetical protein
MSATELQTAFAELPNMADDSMEISSELGQNGEDDIDIDIDLPAGPVDEDYILEDARSEADVDNNTHGRVDDVMVDDDNNSYTMDDAELDDTHIQDVHIQDAQDELAGVPEDTAFTSTALRDMDTVEHEIMTSHEVDVPSNMGGEENSHPEVASPKEAISHTLEPSNVVDVNQAVEVSTNDDRTVSPPKSSDAVEAGATSNNLSAAHELPLDDDQDGQASTEDQVSIEGHKDGPNAVEEHLETDIATRSTDDSSNYGESSIIERQITVLYQNTEYDLFSSSESDDPDSFFLTERSIIHEPITTFLASLKEVIQEDASADDELCLAMDDLALELSEVRLYCPYMVIRANIF